MYIEALTNGGGRVYEVGGSVRDRLLGRKVKDKDLLVTGLPIESISKILEPFGKVTFVGKSFGVLKFYPRDEKPLEIDIAIPRKEMSTGVGHKDFKVEYDPNLPVEVDLGRRDFTVNAMAFDPIDKTLIDPYNGQKDLKKKLIRIVFKKAFLEDPLRLLRAIQFSARFDLEIESKTKKSITENAALIETVSGERVIEEIRKLLLAEKPSIGFKVMAETGLLKHVLPALDATRGISQAKQEGDDVFLHTMKVLDATRADEAIENRNDPELMFAALLHDVGKSKTKRYSEKDKRVVFFGHQIVSARMAKKILRNLKSTTVGVDPKIVCSIIEHHMFETKAFFSEKAIRRFISKISKDLILKLMDFRVADNRGGKYPDGIKGVLRLKKRIIEVMNKKPPFGPTDLAVNGHDLMNLGVPEGPELGKVLGKLVEVVLDDPDLNTPEQLIAIVKDIIDNGFNAGGKSKDKEG